LSFVSKLRQHPFSDLIQEEFFYKTYYKILATGRAYVAFKDVKMANNDPYKLVKKLDKYSEKGAEYGKELAAMIKYNRFYKFD